jgi:hypothetical protein
VTAAAGAGRLGAAVSYLSAALVAVLMAGCFDPRYVEGAACSERQTCPPGQTCDGMFCRLAAVEADAASVDSAATDGADVDAASDAAEADAAAIDAAVDAAVDAVVDATPDATPDATNDAAVDATVDATPVPCNTRDAVASASTTYSGYSAARIHDGDRNTEVGGAYSWTNEEGFLPAWVQLTLAAPCTVSSAVLYTSDPYRIGSYQVQLWDSALGDWRTVADVTGNTDVVRTHGFPTATVTDVRIVGRAGPPHQPQYARVNELELY